MLSGGVDSISVGLYFKKEFWIKRFNYSWLCQDTKDIEVEACRLILCITKKRIFVTQKKF